LFRSGRRQFWHLDQSLRNPLLPDPEQALNDQNPGIHWKTAFLPIKSFTNP
jgi:hypothetical protein